MFCEKYADVFKGDERWRSISTCRRASASTWETHSTYIRKPPFFEAWSREPAPLADITGARVLAVLGDSVTTDHISPAGSIPADGPAGQYLIAHGVRAEATSTRSAPAAATTR